MTDNTIINSGTKEQVAFDLFVYINRKITDDSAAPKNKLDFLKLYVDCLSATKGERQ